MAGSSLTRSAPLVLALLLFTDPQFTTGASEEAQTEPDELKTLSATAGDTVVLRCPLPDTGEYVYWAHVRMTNVIMKHRKSFNFYRIFGQYEATCFEDDYVCLLSIRSVGETDTGYYICVVDSKPPTRHFMHLSVYDPDYDSDTTDKTHTQSSDSTTLEATVGDTVVLRCPVPDTGNNVSWSHQQTTNVIMEHEKSVITFSEYLSAFCYEGDNVCFLRMRRVEKTDTGLYYCMVDSNPSTQHTMYLSVLDREVTMLGEPFRFHLPGSAVNLTCQVQSRQVPEDTVLWLHDNSLIDPDHDSRLTISTETGTTTISHLLLKDAQPEDSGIYTCKLQDGSNDSVHVDVMQVTSGSQRPLAAVPAAGLLALAVAAAAFSSHCR